MKEDRERILRAGFNGYLSKPIDAAALLQELQKVQS
jgi:CheY-like chemotaxis protein